MRNNRIGKQKKFFCSVPHRNKYVANFGMGALSARTNFPKQDQILKNGAQVLWSKLVRKRDGRRIVPVICMCGNKRNARADGIFSDRGRVSGTITGLCKTCACKNRIQIPANHNRWRGGKFIHRGYTYIHKSMLTNTEYKMFEPMFNGHHIPEHRYIMAKTIGRCLNSKEIVHHRDGNKSNNNPSNLELTSAKEHREAERRYYDRFLDAQTKIKELELEIIELKSR